MGTVIPMVLQEIAAPEAFLWAMQDIYCGCQNKKKLLKIPFQFYY